MMEGSRLVWAPPGSFQGPGVSTVPVASFATVPPRKMTVLFFAPRSGFALRSPEES